MFAGHGIPCPYEKNRERSEAEEVEEAEEAKEREEPNGQRRVDGWLPSMLAGHPPRRMPLRSRIV
jgi:hypothetical protein